MMRLRIRTVEHEEVFEADASEVTIGRASRNTLRIADDQSSRQHCRLERLPEGSWRLTDLASRNGTFLNGKLVDEHPLVPGDQIRIGSTTITFELPGEEAPEPRAHEERPEAEPEAPRAVRLVFTTGSRKGDSQIVFEKLTTIGRRPANHIVLSDKGISNRHCEIRRGPDGFVLVDTGSKNGTFLNGRLVLRNPVQPGDQIRLAKTLIQVQPATLDADMAAKVAAEAEAIDAEEAVTDLEEELLAETTTWPRAIAALVVILAVGAGVVYYFRSDIEAWITSKPARAPDLLGGRGRFDSQDSQQAWKPDGDTAGRFARGRLEITLPSRGPLGALASYGYAEQLGVGRGKRYTVAARVRADALSGGFAGLATTWVGKANWEPRATLIVRAAQGAEPWAEAKRTVIPPPWAESLELRCVAAGSSGSVAFDEVTLIDGGDLEALPRFAVDPLTLVMDTPVCFSLVHDRELVTAGVGVAVQPAGGATVVRAPRAEVSSGYPKAGEGRYECGSAAVLPPERVELSMMQSVAYRPGGLRLEYRLWVAKETPVEFAGIELPLPAAAVRTGFDVRTSGGFYQPGRDEASFTLDDAYGLAWQLERGRLFLASEMPFGVECRVDEARAVLRLGQRGGALGTQPLALAFTLRATTPEDERKIAGRLAAAERLARDKRYGAAIVAYEELARELAHRRSESELARSQLALLRREAVERAREALRLLDRAELTGEPRHFEAARAALEPLRVGLKGTPDEAKVADALARCQEQRAAAEQQRQQREAARLLAGARDHQQQDERHIARLYCRELLARFPNTAAADDARALLEALKRPPPEPRAPAPKPGLAPTPSPAPEPAPAPRVPTAE